MFGAPAPADTGTDGTPWCEDASALASLFDLTHVAASKMRDLRAVASFSGMVSRFVKVRPPPGWCSQGRPLASAAL